MNKPLDLGAYMKEVVTGQHLSYAAGVEYAELRHRTIMRALAKAYEDALADPKTRIPTSLQVMLDAVRETVKQYGPA